MDKEVKTLVKLYFKAKEYGYRTLEFETYEKLLSLADGSSRLVNVWLGNKEWFRLNKIREVKQE